MPATSSGHFVSLKQYGRRRTVQYGFIVISLALLLYAIGYFIPDQYALLFVASSMVARLIEGAGISSSLTAMVSLVTKLYPHEIGFAQSVRFLGAFSGMTLGVIVGAFLFEALGYFGVFMTFSVIVLFTSLLMFVFKENASRESNDDINNELTYCSLFKVRRVFLVLVCS